MKQVLERRSSSRNGENGFNGRRLKVGLDCDDVSADTTIGGLIPFLDAEYGIKILPNEMFSLDLVEVLKALGYGEIDREIERGIHRHFWSDWRFKEVLPIEGAPQAVEEMRNEGAEFSCITSRFFGLKPETARLYRAHFNRAVSHNDIHHAFNPHQGKGLLTKPDIAVVQGVHVMIEDSPISVRQLVERRIPTVVPETPMNRYEQLPGAIRVENMLEASEIILRLKPALLEGNTRLFY